jgi:hypothetical protein
MEKEERPFPREILDRILAITGNKFVTYLFHSYLISFSIAPLVSVMNVKPIVPNGLPSPMESYYVWIVLENIEA